MGNCDVEENIECMEVIEFELNTDNSVEKYGIEVLYVDEVYSVKKVTALPCTPPFIVGIINFRGKIISVIDIRNFLGFSIKKIDGNNVKKVIVIKVEEMEVAVAVDSILGCDKIPLTKIQRNVFSIINLKADYFKGVTTREMSIILNVENIMRDEKIIVDEEVI